jgi:threonine-phosphate decarboxylase
VEVVVSDHGGNIRAASQRTGIPEEEIMDFSASINPLGVPKNAARVIRRQIGRLRHYPEPYSERLATCVARHLGIADSGSILCGNGSTELIYLIPRALKPARVLIPAPTFSEYERACRNCGSGEIIPFPLRPETDFDVPVGDFIDAMAGKHADMAFLCNPNNPTGRLVKKQAVLEIADSARQTGCYLVVDEAFIDFCSDGSVVKEVERNPSLIVLRSLTKFYALSGLRIGYGVAHPAVAAGIKAFKEPWTVSSLAQEVGVSVLEDEIYQKTSLAAMAKEKAFMEAGFRRIGIDFVPSSANYYLLRLEKDAPQAVSALEQTGILVRDCSNFKGLGNRYIRVAVRSRRENRILLKEMARICGRSS